VDGPSALLILAGAALVGAALLWSASRVSAALERARADAARSRTLQLIALFAPGVAAARDDPRALLAWQPLAATARRIFADEFAALDTACGATFPFSPADLQAAHARWTADWLAWEGSHDTEYKLEAAAVEAELAASGAPIDHLARARLAAIDREKLERYQRRYEEYTRVSKALQTLMARD
jgi:hypothetical protein